MTLVIFTLMCFYASIKFVHLSTHHNPDVSAHSNTFFYDSSDKIDLYDFDTRVAFGVEGFLDGETKDDPAYVKYISRLWGKRDGVGYEKFIDHHVCSLDELALFENPSSESAAALDNFRKGKNRRLFCLDHDNLNNGELSLWGVTNDDNYQRWEFVLVPCNYIHKEFGDVGDKIHESCINDH